MRDQVAEILGERQKLDTSRAAGVVLSILLHGSIAAAVVYSAFHRPASQPMQPVSIRFAQLPEPVRPAPPVTPRIEEPKPEPVTPPKVTAPPEPKTVPVSPFGKSKKRGSENPQVVPAPKTRQSAPAAVAEGETGVELEGGDFPYTLYVDQMKRAIGSRWLRPDITGAKTVVYFVIERDGRIRDARVELPSGNGTFDRAALRAVMESSPLPPLPFGYNGTYLGVHLTFR